jgi:hypothetical protein
MPRIYLLRFIGNTFSASEPEREAVAGFGARMSRPQEKRRKLLRHSQTSNKYLKVSKPQVSREPASAKP